jgi:hypothetical protein
MSRQMCCSCARANPTVTYGHLSLTLLSIHSSLATHLAGISVDLLQVYLVLLCGHLSFSFTNFRSPSQEGLAWEPCFKLGTSTWVRGKFFWETVDSRVVVIDYMDRSRGSFTIFPTGTLYNSVVQCPTQGADIGVIYLSYLKFSFSFLNYNLSFLYIALLPIL